MPGDHASPRMVCNALKAFVGHRRAGWRTRRHSLWQAHRAAAGAGTARLDPRTSPRIACAANWLVDVAFLPEAEELGVDQLYRALDCLRVWPEEIERGVFLQAPDLLRLDVDLIPALSAS